MVARSASAIAARLLMRLLCLTAAAVALAACSGDGPAIAVGDPEGVLKRIVLQQEDAGDGLALASARAQTNEEAAVARPDSGAAREQYEAWGQVLSYNVQFAAPVDPALVFTSKTARLMNTATLYRRNDGASDALAFLRGLDETLVENFLKNEGAGTRISDTQLVKDLDVEAKGDESFAWRISGKATFDDGFTITFVADSVFLRVENVTGNVTAVALGGAPERAQLESYVDAFVARIEDARE